MKLLTDLNELNGRSVISAVESGGYFFLKLDNEEGLCIRAGFGYDARGDCEVVDSDHELDNDQKLAFGFMTQAEYDSEKERQRARWEEQDRRKYEELKARFEPDS